MSFSPVWSLFGLTGPVIARSIRVHTAQLLRHRPIVTVCQRPSRVTRVYVSKSWISNRLSILPGLLTATRIAGIVLGVTICTAPTIHCDDGQDTQGPDTEGSDTQGPDTEGPDTQGPDTEGSDTQGPDTEGPDTEGSDTEGSDTEGSDTQGPNTEGPDTEGSDTQDFASTLPPPSQAPLPQSGINLRELRFDKIIGVCVGFLIKLALGPVFVLFRLLNPMSLFRVDLNTGDTQFENPFYIQDGLGNRSAPTSSSVREWVAGFFSEEFQPQSFKDGFETGYALAEARKERWNQSDEIALIVHAAQKIRVVLPSLKAMSRYEDTIIRIFSTALIWYFCFSKL